MSHNYTTETVDNTEYLVITDKPGNSTEQARMDNDPYKYSLETAFSEDFDTLVDFIASTDNPQTLAHYWHAIPYAGRGYRIDYFTQSRPVLEAFASNSNTPREILENVLLNAVPYGEMYLGVEPEILDMFLNHPNSDRTLVEEYKDRCSRMGEHSQGEFDELQALTERAERAFEADPDLYERLRSVREASISRTQKSKTFNPEDVEKVGVEYVYRNFVPLFGAEYDEKTGTFTGWID